MIKTTYKLLALCFFVTLSFNIEAQVLDLESTTDGLLVPRMTTIQKDAITNLSQSLMVYDTDTKSFWYYEDMMWNELGGGESINGFSGDSGAASPNAPIIDGDLTGVSSIISLGDPGVITIDTQIEICVNIDHGYSGDVDIILTASDGTTTLDLASDNGTSNNYMNTCFTTSATMIISNALSPYIGSFIPEQPFSNLINQSIAGDWTLTVVDDDPIIDSGTFLSWSIAFQNGDALGANLLSDVDNDTRIQVEKIIDEDVIRVEVKGTETLTLTDDNAQFNTSVTAPSFIGDGSQLTGIATSSGGCNKYGDGSAGDVIISSSTDWSISPPTNGNFMFNNLTINAGQTLTVCSGTIIMVANDFSNAGTIQVLPGIEGERSSTHINGVYPRVDGYTLSQFIAYPTNQLRFITNPKLKGGGNGEDGNISTTVISNSQESGSGGGTLVIRAANTLVNSGTINATGGNAIQHSDPSGDFTGAGGGGGGFLILIGVAITNSGTINVNGGNGANSGTGDDDHSGGGGGGGLVHYISGNANAVSGTVNFSGGSGGVTPVANLGSSGGDGGTSAGNAGRGGTDTGGFVQPTAGGTGVIIRTEVADPCSLSFD